jgi:hypothetical protein
MTMKLDKGDEDLGNVVRAAAQNIFANPEAASLKRVAWAYGSIRAGSDDEARLFKLLCEKQRSSASSSESTPREVESIATFPLDLLLDELIECTVRYRLGDLAVDERRLATALLDRFAMLGIARKEHHAGCEIWSEQRLCRCTWSVPS